MDCPVEFHRPRLRRNRRRLVSAYDDNRQTRTIVSLDALRAHFDSFYRIRNFTVIHFLRTADLRHLSFRAVGVSPVLAFLSGTVGALAVERARAE